MISEYSINFIECIIGGIDKEWPKAPIYADWPKIRNWFELSRNCLHWADHFKLNSQEAFTNVIQFKGFLFDVSLSSIEFETSPVLPLKLTRMAPFIRSIPSHWTTQHWAILLPCSHWSIIVIYSIHESIQMNAINLTVKLLPTFRYDILR